MRAFCHVSRMIQDTQQHAPLDGLFSMASFERKKKPFIMPRDCQPRSYLLIYLIAQCTTWTHTPQNTRD